MAVPDFQSLMLPMELSRLMVEKEVGVRVTETYKIRKIDENYFTE
jgi:restriction endonuclease Mrr